MCSISNNKDVLNRRYACFGKGSTLADGTTTQRRVAHEQRPQRSSEGRNFHEDLEFWGHETAPWREGSKAHRNLGDQRQDCLQKVLQGSQTGRQTGHLLWTSENGLRQRGGVVLVRRGIPWLLPFPPSYHVTTFPALGRSRGLDVIFFCR